MPTKEEMEKEINNLGAQYEQTSLQIKSYRLQYTLMSVLLIFIVYNHSKLLVKNDFYFFEHL